MASNTPLGGGSGNYPQISIFRESTANTSPAGVRLDELLSEMEPEIRCLARPNIAIQVGCQIPEPSPVVSLSPDDAQDLIRHLVIDACDAMPTGGTLRLVVGRLIVDSTRPEAYPELSPGSYVTLLVRDTSTGDANGREAAPPSHSTSSLKKGRTLGLTAAYEAIQSCGGSVSVSKRPQETAICIYFPCQESARQS